MDTRNRNILLIGIAIALLFFCCCVIALTAFGSALLFLTPQSSASIERPEAQGPVEVITAAPLRPTRTVPTMIPEAPAANATSASLSGSAAKTPTRSRAAATANAPKAQPTQSSAAPAATALPRPAGAISTTEDMLSTVDMPERDLRQLALRLKPQIGEIPVVVNGTAPTYQVGDTISFWTENSDTQEHHHISATLRYVTPHVYVWVEKGVNLDDNALAASAERFETKTYPTDREFFGSEWTPGVDDDVHLSLLHATDLGANIAGYYSSSDEFSHLINPYSNEKEMFYISADSGAAEPDTDFYDGVLAHEFQHMIHWHNDRNEESWVNEGMSELAAHLNGYDVGGADIAFSRKPDTQLNTWSDPSQGNAEHYGASYLFMEYFLGRFGEDLTKAVVADKENGIAGFNDALAKAGRPERFDDIFADWVVANYLNRPDVAPKGRFGYTDINPPAPAIARTWDRLPASGKGDVGQYAADYIQLRRPGGGPVDIKFTGGTGVGLVDTTPRGQYAWWSNRGDDSDSTLTREFDLSGLKSATLNFSAWYDIEDGWDYVYAEASTDGGKTWNVLPGQNTSDKDKSGNAFGPGWTGKSGGGDTAEWIDEKVDLSAYAGQKILLRFEYVTDDAVNGPGFLLDDIAIPELNYSHNGENGPDGWDAKGWILTDNQLSQNWLVQLVTSGSDGVKVQRINVGPDGQGELNLPDTNNVNNMMLIVSALAPVTSEQASYSYNIMAR
jgi:immune inhibitor A